MANLRTCFNTGLCSCQPWTTGTSQKCYVCSFKVLTDAAQEYLGSDHPSRKYSHFRLSARRYSMVVSSIKLNDAPQTVTQNCVYSLQAQMESNKRGRENKNQVVQFTSTPLPFLCS